MRALAEPKNKWITIDALQEPRDFACIMYARLGFGMDLIMRLTKLTKGQVRGRLKKYGVNIGEYRRGESDVAQEVLRKAKDYVEKSTLAYIKKHMLE